jgi:enediyne biosynthesis protein E4
MLAAVVAHSQASPGEPTWSFYDVASEAGTAILHADAEASDTPTRRVAGGVAAADYDRDGDTDLYVVAGSAALNRLLQNRGDGTFDDVTAGAGVVLERWSSSGPLFFDYDGDGWSDLFVGATDGDWPRLFRNERNGTFSDVTESVGLALLTNSVSATAGDYDGDGWLDLFVSHWGSFGCHLWQNQGGAHFECVDEVAGIEPFGSSGVDQSFTANFVDIDENGAMDILVASDFGTSRVLVNQGQGAFLPWSSSVISDENGMGAAIGDYDGDGALDWFVSSIWDADGTTEGDWGTTGNRLYRNRGDGSFADATDSAGVREGDWGWATCFADLNLDGALDLVEVNGWPQGSPQFRDTPARLFLGSTQGRFTEAGTRLGFDERRGGRGLVCFDADGDGDIDLFIMNNGASAALWRNDGGSRLGNHLVVKLVDQPPNSDAVGARLRVRAGGREQVRLIRAGSNYVSQDPLEAHFGLAHATVVEELEVVWPDGARTTRDDLAVNQRIEIVRSDDERSQRSRARPRSSGCSVAPGTIGRR